MVWKTLGRNMSNEHVVKHNIYSMCLFYSLRGHFHMDTEPPSDLEISFSIIYFRKTTRKMVKKNIALFKPNLHFPRASFHFTLQLGISIKIEIILYLTDNYIYNVAMLHSSRYNL